MSRLSTHLVSICNMFQTKMSPSLRGGTTKQSRKGYMDRHVLLPSSSRGQKPVIATLSLSKGKQSMILTLGPGSPRPPAVVLAMTVIHFLQSSTQKISRALPSWKYLLFGLLLCAGYSFAADVNNDSDALRMIVQVLNLVFTVITFLLTPAIILAGWLLSPDWTMGDFFGLRPYFINVWVLVSNLVYIIFALMLLWMAAMQIFSSESNYAFKNKIRRFLVGIMIVPFTWLIVSWTLSFANQAVAAVLSIPMGAISSMQSTDESKSFFHNRVIPTKFVLDFAEDAPAASPDSVGCGSNGETTSGGGENGDEAIKCISPAEFVTYNQSGPFFIIMIYAYGIFKIQETEQVNFSKVCGATDGSTLDAESCITSIGQFLSKFGVAFITTLFFAIILIALCWVLLARAFKLWIYVMFSPLFGLAYAVSKDGLGETKSLNSSDGGGSGGGAKLGEVGFIPFFKLAMVPVLVSAVLAFGLLFIGVINNTFTTGALSEESSGSGTFCTSGEFMVKYCIEEDGNAEQGYSSRIIIGDENATAEDGRSVAIIFEFGDMMSGFVGNSAAGDVASGTATAMTDIFAHIILSLIALVVMWMGVKAAVSYDDVTKAAFAPFEKFGSSVGNFVQNIPSYLPTPHPAFAAFNPGTYSAMGSGITKSVTDQVNSTQQRTLADTLGTEGSNALNRLSASQDGSTEATNRLSEELERTQRGDKSSRAALEAMKKGLSTRGAKLEGPDKIKFDIISGQLTNANSREGLATILKDNKFTDSPMQRLSVTVQSQGPSSSPIVPTNGTIGRITQTNSGVSILGTSNLEVMKVDGETVNIVDTSIKTKITKAAGTSNTLTDTQVKELFGPDANFTPNQKEAIVTQAKK